jgi:hypothetical protein
MISDSLHFSHVLRGYLTIPSVSGLFSISGRMSNEYGAVGGM